MTGWIIGGLVFLAAADAAFLFFWVPRLVDRKLEHFQSDLMDRHYDEVENMYRTMRGWRHDYHNHIQAMKAYAELGKYGELIAYLGRLDENLYQVDTVIKTGNLMMDAVLGSKLGLMKKRGIRTDVTVHVPKGMKLTDMELCVLVGNLLDNAIEACRKIPEREKRRISLKARYTENGYFSCEIVNSKKNAIRKKKDAFLTDKEDARSHGLGIASIRDVVRRYDGTLDISYTKEEFRVVVLIKAK